jgi:hypothetical protein
MSSPSPTNLASLPSRALLAFSPSAMTPASTTTLSTPGRKRAAARRSGPRRFAHSARRCCTDAPPSRPCFIDRPCESSLLQAAGVVWPLHSRAALLQPANPAASMSTQRRQNETRLCLSALVLEQVAPTTSVRDPQSQWSPRPPNKRSPAASVGSQCRQNASRGPRHLG